ncbi:MAG: hypothetical protein V5A64_01585 [Candidatus Thermoplasmatota archaeon]
MSEKNNDKKDKKSLPYNVEDALKVADDIINLGNEKKYNIGAFVHGMVFALEYAQHTYKIPQQQIANIRRGCKKYFKEIDGQKQGEQEK